MKDSFGTLNALMGAFMTHAYPCAVLARSSA
jgi:hypothetical protein